MAKAVVCRRGVICGLGLLAVALLLAGCWDRIEINRRALAHTVGIDLAPEDAAERVTATGTAPRFRLSVELPILRGLAQGGNALAVLPDLEKPAQVISGVGSTLYSIERAFATRVNQTISWAHVRSLVVGEDFAREVGLYPIMDFLTRHREFDRRVRVGVAEGEALRILEEAVLAHPFVGPYLVDLLERAPTDALTPNVTLNQLDAAMRRGGNILLPRYVLLDEAIEASGAAVIKTGKLIGWLDELHTQWALFVRNEVQEAWVLVPDPAVPGAYVVFEVQGSVTRLRLMPEDGPLHLEIQVVMEGIIGERTAFDDPIDDALLERLRQAVAQTVEAGITGAVRLLQERFQADVLGFNDYLAKWHPALWRQVREDWDEVGFRAVSVTPRVTVKIRRFQTLR